MQYTNAHSPSFDATGGIQLFVTFEGLGEVPFGASPNDAEAHGREIYARALAGEYGEVAPYVAPPEIPPSRQELVNNIIVTTISGKLFDGNEVAQQRISRAIQALQIANQTSTKWKLADNTISDVTLVELQEALVLAGTEMTRIWIS